MKSYKDYTKRAAEAAETQQKQKDRDMDGSNGQSSAYGAEDLAKQIADVYNGKSNATVLKGILEEAERSKRAGTLSNEELETFYQSFSPMLNGFQRKQLRAVVDRLKEI